MSSNSIPYYINTGLLSGVCLLLAAPLGFIALSWIIGEAPYFGYFITNDLLSTYAVNSLAITLGTVVCASILGIVTAWWVTMLEFPLRTTLQWALIVPLAVPSYIAAIVYGKLLEEAGPLQYALRDMLSLHYGEYAFFRIRSAGGAVFVLSVTLYPYMFMLARTAFLMQSQHMLETASILGLGKYQRFFRLALPMARPALVAGAALIAMEALADFGVVSLYGVPSLTTGIYRAWQGMYDPTSAARIAFMLFAIVAVCLGCEKISRGSAQYINNTALYHPLPRTVLSGWRAWGVTILCSVPILAGVGVPLTTLLYWGVPHLELLMDSTTLHALLSSTTVAVATAAFTVILALVFAYRLRLYPNVTSRVMTACATYGYAMPGSVIAIGVLLLCLLLQEIFVDGAPVLTATLVALIWGCSVRFLTIAFHNVQSGLTRITPALDEAAIMLGAQRKQLLRLVHLPLLRGSLVASVLLVFIDTIKELPATMLLRPYDMTTLSVRVYELAMDNRVVQAAPVGLILIGLSVIPLILLNRQLNRARPCDNTLLQAEYAS